MFSEKFNDMKEGEECFLFFLRLQLHLSENSADSGVKTDNVQSLIEVCMELRIIPIFHLL